MIRSGDRVELASVGKVATGIKVLREADGDVPPWRNPVGRRARHTHSTLKREEPHIVV